MPIVRKLSVSYTVSMLQANCGLFNISEDHIEDYQSLDQRFIKNKSSTFFFQATGDSMEPLVFAGDVLVVDRSINSFYGKIAIIYLEGQFLCKRILKSPKGLILRSENKLHRDILITEEMDFLVWGVVTSLARDVRSR